MYCPKCGWKNADNARQCANCFEELPSPRSQAPQQPQPVQQTQQMPWQPQQTAQPYPQQPYSPQQQGQKYINIDASRSIPDHLVWSIIAAALSLLICPCGFLGIPFGIVAVIKSAQCATKKSIGDYYGALSDSNAAKMWLIVTLCAWVAQILLAAIIVFCSRR